jgi:hypothetical protein
MSHMAEAQAVRSDTVAATAQAEVMRGTFNDCPNP